MTHFPHLEVLGVRDIILRDYKPYPKRTNETWDDHLVSTVFEHVATKEALKVLAFGDGYVQGEYCGYDEAHTMNI